MTRTPNLLASTNPTTNNKAAPGALDSLKGFAQGLKANLDGLKDGATSLADGAGKASLPSLPKLDLQGIDVGDLPLSNELKAKVAELGGAVGSKLSDLGGAVGEQAGKALTPYQPLIDQTAAQLSDKLAVVQPLIDRVQQLADQVSKEVSKDAEQLEPALGVLSSVGPRNLFNVENAVALPFWLTLILAPNNGLVKGLVRKGVVGIESLQAARLPPSSPSHPLTPTIPHR